MIPARTSRLPAIAPPSVVGAARERGREIGVRPHRHTLETVRVGRRRPERPAAVAARRDVPGASERLPQLWRSAGVVAVGVCEEPDRLAQPALELRLRALELD